MADGIFNLDRTAFNATLRELEDQGMDTAHLRRQYREQRSPFAGVFDWASREQGKIDEAGRRPIAGGLLSKDVGATGMDALRSAQFEPRAFISGLLGSVAEGVDAPAAAMRGDLTGQDAENAALNTAGMAMLGGGLATKPAGALGANSIRSVVEKYPDVEVDIFGDAKKGYELSKIKVPKDAQGSGLGTKVMSELVDAADTEGSRISLTPDTSFGGTSVSRLKDFYKRFGFVENKGRNKDFSTRNTMYRDPTAMANASKSAGLLGSVASDVSQRGDDILGMLKSGKAGDITNEMLDMGDSVKNTRLNQYLFENYDLPMDEASRMARAREMGLTDDQYHATKADFANFLPSETGLSGRGIYAGDYPAEVLDYAIEGQGRDNLSLIPIRTPVSEAYARNIDWQRTMDADEQFPYDATVEETVAGFKRAADTMSEQGYAGVHNQPGERVTFDPKNIRSRFARFDPRLSHLSNLTAANASTPAGLLAGQMSSEEQRAIEEYLNRKGLLQ